MLETALASGALTVRHADGRSITYQSQKDIEAYLAKLKGQAADEAGDKRVSRLQVELDRGI